MAKSYLSDYSPTPASNTDIDGVDSTGATGRVKDGDNYTRSVMSHLAKFYDDLGAVNTVGGTATAITVTAAEGWTAYGSSANQIDTGTILAIKTGSAATGATTLNVNGIGAKAIRGQGDVAIQANDWIAGSILILRYDASFNAAAGAWVLVNTIANLTPFARTLLDDADAATARTTLGAEGELAAGTAAQYYRGDKSWQTLDKAAVGLGNVDNTADASKSVNYAASAGTTAAVPVGVVVSRGSNANGEYVRYHDGTQICWAAVNGGAALRTWTFPAAFSYSVGASATPLRTASTTARIAIIRALSTGGLDTAVFDTLFNLTADPILCTATGRWF